MINSVFFEFNVCEIFYFIGNVFLILLLPSLIYVKYLRYLTLSFFFIVCENVYGPDKSESFLDNACSIHINLKAKRKNAEVAEIVLINKLFFFYLFPK